MLNTNCGCMRNLATILFIFSALSWANAQPGVLDVNFDTDGKLLLNLNTTEAATGLAIQPDQKILVGGYTGAGSDIDFFVMRLNPDGSFDPNFGNAGVVITDMLSSTDLSNDLVLQPDGKIILIGFINDGSTIKIGMVRYLADGTLDPDFGVGGKAVSSGNFSNAIGWGASLQTDGKILVTGMYNNAGNNDLLVARFNSDGTPDVSFSYDGFMSLDVSGNGESGYVVKQRSDGKILVGGFTEIPMSTRSMLIVRLEENGLFDNTFGTNGFVEIDYGLGYNECRDFALRGDKLLVYGSSDGVFGSAMALAQLNEDGSFDTDFGTAGMDVYTMLPTESTGTSMLVTPDGKIVTIGSIGGASSADFAIVRRESDGSSDNAFGTAGGTATDFDGDYDGASEIEMQSDGLFVVAGRAIHGAEFDIALARYISGINIGIGEVETYLGSTLIYPNPIAGNSAVLEYTVNEPIKVQVELWSVDGKQISILKPWQFQVAGTHQQQLILPELSAGNYLLKVRTEMGAVTIKILVQ